MQEYVQYHMAHLMLACVCLTSQNIASGGEPLKSPSPTSSSNKANSSGRLSLSRPTPFSCESDV